MGDIIGYIIMSAIILGLIILGILFNKGKASFLIAGYNTMSKPEKEKYNINALLKLMSKVMYFSAFYVLIILVSLIRGLKNSKFTLITTIIFIVAMIFIIIYANTSKKFKNNKKQ